MSIDTNLISTTFRLAADDAGRTDQAEQRFEVLRKKHMDGYPVELDADDEPGNFMLWMEVEEVGHSFSERLTALLNEMMDEGLILSAARVTIREDVMSDDRDHSIHIGPNQAAIAHFQEEERIKAIAELMHLPRTHPDMQSIAQRLHRKTREQFIELLAEQSKFTNVDMGGEAYNIRWAQFTSINVALDDSGWKLDPELGPIEVPRVPTAVLEVNSNEVSLLGASAAVKVVFVDRDYPDTPDGVYTVHESTGATFATDHVVAYAAHMAAQSTAQKTSQTESFVGKLWWNADDMTQAQAWKADYLAKGAISVELEPESDRSVVSVFITLDRNRAKEILGHDVGEEEWLDLSEEPPQSNEGKSERMRG